MLERTKVSSTDLFPEVQNQVFTITKPVEKEKTPGGKPYYRFTFETFMANGERKKYVAFYMVFLCGEMLNALGAKKIGEDTYEWDRDKVVGQQILANVVHEPDFKDKTKKRSRLEMIRPYPPEQPLLSVAGPEEIPF